MKPCLFLLFLLCLMGCSVFEDEATSMARDIERGVRKLAGTDGAVHVVVHDARARASAEVRTVTVQFDQVGALIVWYKDSEGKVLASGSTTYLSRIVAIPETILLDKPIDSPLRIELQRRNGRAIVARVY